VQRAEGPVAEEQARHGKANQRPASLSVTERQHVLLCYQTTRRLCPPRRAWTWRPLPRPSRDPPQDQLCRQTYGHGGRQGYRPHHRHRPGGRRASFGTWYIGTTILRQTARQGTPLRIVTDSEPGEAGVYDSAEEQELAHKVRQGWHADELQSMPTDLYTGTREGYWKEGRRR
jgi:hypothetical protein